MSVWGPETDSGCPLGANGNKWTTHTKLADGLPYEFDAFTVSGRSAALDELIALTRPPTRVSVEPATAGPRTDELPLGRDVVVFPAN